MFNLFSRASENRLFRARSARRDTEADYSRVKSVLGSIEEALKVTEAEHSGLNARLQDVLARAAVSLGNGTDEYLTRESADTEVQNQFDAEIASGQRRLEQLLDQIKAFKFLRSALITRFPDLKLHSSEDQRS